MEWLCSLLLDNQTNKGQNAALLLAIEVIFMMSGDRLKRIFGETSQSFQIWLLLILRYIYKERLEIIKIIVSATTQQYKVNGMPRFLSARLSTVCFVGFRKIGESPTFIFFLLLFFGLKVPLGNNFFILFLFILSFKKCQ